MSKLRIACINELYGTARSGGEQEAMFALAQRLNVLPDLQVDTYSYSGRGSILLPRLASDRIRLTPYVREMFASPRLGKYVAEKIAPKYDIVHTSSTTLFAHVRCPVPLVVSFHAIRSQKAEFLKGVWKYRLALNPIVQRRLAVLERQALVQASRLVVLRDRMQKFLVNRLGLAGSRVIEISNPVDTELFRPADVSGSLVLFVGRATIAKGIDTLLSAAPGIRGEIMIVTRVMSSEMEQRLTAKGIRVLRDVAHDQLAPLYQQARALVLPSLDEEQPLTVLEAMASGIPVVVTPAAAAGIVEDGVHGLIIPEQNPKALAAAVNRLLDDAKLANRLGRAGRQRTETHHAWPTVTAAYRQVFQEATSAPVRT